MSASNTDVGVSLSVRGLSQWVAHLKTAATAMAGVTKGTKGADDAADKFAKGSLRAMHAGLDKLYGLSKRAVEGLGGIAAVLGGIGVKQAMTIQKVTAQTNAVIASTGGVAHVTSGHVGSLADTIEGYSGVQNTTVQQAENLLLVFTKVRNEVGKGNAVFDEATVAVTDMSRALGRDLPATATMVGKALQDPMKGIQMLRRAGVEFTAQQQAQIKALWDSNNVLGAQKIILGQLQTMYGGQAKAYGQTLPGALARFRAVGVDALGKVANTALLLALGPLQGIDALFTRVNRRLPALLSGIQSYMTGAMGRARAVFAGGVPTDMGGWTRAIETILGPRAKGVAPIIARIVVAVQDLIRIARGMAPVLEQWAKDWLPPVVAGLVVVGTILHFVANNMTWLRPIIYSLGTAFATFLILNKIDRSFKALNIAVKEGGAIWKALNAVMLMNPWILLAVAIVAVAAGLFYAYKHVKWFHDAVDATGRFIKTVAVGAFNWLRTNWPLVLAILAGPFALFIYGLVRYRRQIVRWLSDLRHDIATIGKFLWLGIVNGFIDAINAVIRTWNWFIAHSPVGLVGKLLGHSKAGQVGTIPHVGGAGAPLAHEGGTVTAGGMVNMRPGEELVNLPTGATVTPVSIGDRQQQRIHDAIGSTTVQLVVDRRVLAEATIAGLRAKAARQ